MESIDLPYLKKLYMLNPKVTKKSINILKFILLIYNKNKKIGYF